MPLSYRKGAFIALPHSVFMERQAAFTTFGIRPIQTNDDDDFFMRRLAEAQKKAISSHALVALIIASVGYPRATKIQ